LNPDAETENPETHGNAGSEIPFHSTEAAVNRTPKSVLTDKDYQAILTIRSPDSQKVVHSRKMETEINARHQNGNNNKEQNVMFEA
jgi:hypothetical protein